MSKTLLVWQELPESISLYVFESGSKEDELCAKAHNTLINVNENEATFELNDILENVLPVWSSKHDGDKVPFTQPADIANVFVSGFVV